MLCTIRVRIIEFATSFSRIFLVLPVGLPTFRINLPRAAIDLDRRLIRRVSNMSPKRPFVVQNYSQIFELLTWPNFPIPNLNSNTVPFPKTVSSKCFSLHVRQFHLTTMSRVLSAMYSSVFWVSTSAPDHPQNFPGSP